MGSIVKLQNCVFCQEKEGLSTTEIWHEFIHCSGCHCSRSSCSYTLPCKGLAYLWPGPGGMSNTQRLFPSQGKPIWKFWSSVICMAMCLVKGNNCFSSCSLLTSHEIFNSFWKLFKELLPLNEGDGERRYLLLVTLIVYFCLVLGRLDSHNF